MHLDSEAIRTCILPVAAVAHRRLTTIEGLADGDNLHSVQQAWLAHDVPQCGYCQSGQIMAATALLTKNPNPSDTYIDTAMSGNICRCGTYPRIRKAIYTATENLQKRLGYFTPNQSENQESNL